MKLVLKSAFLTSWVSLVLLPNWVFRLFGTPLLGEELNQSTVDLLLNCLLVPSVPTGPFCGRRDSDHLTWQVAYTWQSAPICSNLLHFPVPVERLAHIADVVVLKPQVERPTCQRSTSENAPLKYQGLLWECKHWKLIQPPDHIHTCFSDWQSKT